MVHVFFDAMTMVKVCRPSGLPLPTVTVSDRLVALTVRIRTVVPRSLLFTYNPLKNPVPTMVTRPLWPTMTLPIIRDAWGTMAVQCAYRVALFLKGNLA